MDLLDAVLVVTAGAAAGTINAAVGSGSLITFPTLLAIGVPPVTANISNNIGLVPGGLAGVWGYRRELAGQRRRLLLFGSMSAVGGITGAVLLLVLPAESFKAVVPALIGLAITLVAVQPWIQRALARRRARTAVALVGAPGPGSAGGEPSAEAPPEGPGPVSTPGGLLATALVGVYGGYFGGAQGILLIGALGALMVESLQRLNALKNALTTVVNGIATGTFLVLAPHQVDWRLVGLIAAGSTAGGLLGARIGRRLPQSALRVIIVVVGVVAIVNLVRPA